MQQGAGECRLLSVGGSDGSGERCRGEMILKRKLRTSVLCGREAFMILTMGRGLKGEPGKFLSK